MNQRIPENPNKESVRTVLELALHEEEQLAIRANWLDTKTGVILGFVIVSVAELLGFLLLASREGINPSVKSTSHPYLLAIVFVLGLVALIAAMFCGLFESYPMGFQYGASTEILAGRVDKSPEEIEAQCLGSLRETAVHNRGIVHRKAWWTKATVVAVGAALLFYVVAVLILFFSLL
jgi:hypothetical protein